MIDLVHKHQRIKTFGRNDSFHNVTVKSFNYSTGLVAKTDQQE